MNGQAAAIGEEVIPQFLPHMLHVRTDIILTSDEDEDSNETSKSAARRHPRTPKTTAAKPSSNSDKRITPNKKQGKRQCWYCHID